MPCLFIQFGCVYMYHSVGVYLTSWVPVLDDTLGQREREVSGQDEPQWSRFRCFVLLSMFLVMGSSAAASPRCCTWINLHNFNYCVGDGVWAALHCTHIIAHALLHLLVVSLPSLKSIWWPGNSPFCLGVVQEMGLFSAVTLADLNQGFQSGTCTFGCASWKRMPKPLQ